MVENKHETVSCVCQLLHRLFAVILCRDIKSFWAPPFNTLNDIYNTLINVKLTMHSVRRAKVGS